MVCCSKSACIKPHNSLIYNLEYILTMTKYATVMAVQYIGALAKYGT